MGITADILAILDRIPVWKRLRGLDGRMERLEERVATLEAALRAAANAPRPPTNPCSRCGKETRILRIGRGQGETGAPMEAVVWCDNCETDEIRPYRAPPALR
jgi:hypothetical protein